MEEHDEFPTIYLNNMDGRIATASSNKVATTLGVQDFTSLKRLWEGPVRRDHEYHWGHYFRVT